MSKKRTLQTKPITSKKKVKPYAELLKKPTGDTLSLFSDFDTIDTSDFELLLSYHEKGSESSSPTTPENISHSIECTCTPFIKSEICPEVTATLKTFAEMFQRITKERSQTCGFAYLLSLDQKPVKEPDTIAETFFSDLENVDTS